MNLDFYKHQFFLHPSGAMFWPLENLLVVADMHLEKGTHYAKRGYFLPPYDTRKTLARLLDILKFFNPSRIMILGDCFHDAHAYQRLGSEERAMFNSLLDYNPLWVKGNHDGDFVPEGFESHDNVEMHGLRFRHEAVPGDIAEISGHFHPKIELAHKGGYFSRPCFVEDGKKLFLPAFGAYTGGLSVADPAFRSLLGPDSRVHILGNEKIYTRLVKIVEK
jgi:DNA ligase-associated metallophosphoesterase